MIRQIALVSGLVFLLAACQSQNEPQQLKIATTTSTNDSGLMDYLLPDFEEKYNAKVDVIAVGTGQALALGESGDV
ncbi:MAG TPA: tungsten ABC transporter substrate-binding protein, partial [Anaerolineae bacterium]|nr:tungsten ABC transporter substrate-binding protein [Anaerolineae bacterium]